ncbi:hypothetical protein [Actinomadura sp. 7K507]|uniref:hypothetical protein n=1 Tax=Actinomadura sp. 7K507 TaxID=2530365 RepID=UPI00104E22B4|nr:hypothetical protein [Actinomadura sp. 7K507]TDC73664.1 hypothetical protein E1285_44435 [Actinomadura sp. 7K507]
MRAFSLLMILLVTMSLVFVGSIAYGNSSFIAWGLVVVALGAGVQILLHRRGVSYRENPQSQETAVEVLRQGSFLKLYPPFPVALALVAMAIIINTGPPGLIILPLVSVMACTAVWQGKHRG